MLYTHLKKMEERPGMYGCESVEDIFKFIFGYSSALYDYQIIDKDSEHFNGFPNFVNNHIHYKNSATHHNWAMLIRFYSDSCKESFDIFFTLFNEFITLPKIMRPTTN